MKSIARMNILIDRSRREDDAGHSWHMAMCALVLFEYAQEPDLDLLKILKMCLVHDLVEIYAGDTYCYDRVGNQSKMAREQASADRLFAQLPVKQGREFRALWDEFDAMETKEGLYAAAVDRVQPFLLNYHTDGHTWQFADIYVDDLLRRLAPVEFALPDLWNVLLEMIEDCKQRGLIKEKE
jgi:putative hydrolase of HD superfamily